MGHPRGGLVIRPPKPQPSTVTLAVRAIRSQFRIGRKIAKKEVKGYLASIRGSMFPSGVKLKPDYDGWHDQTEVCCPDASIYREEVC